METVNTLFSSLGITILIILIVIVLIDYRKTRNATKKSMESQNKLIEEFGDRLEKTINEMSKSFKDSELAKSNDSQAIRTHVSEMTLQMIKVLEEIKSTKENAELTRKEVTMNREDFKSLKYELDGLKTSVDEHSVRCMNKRT